MPNIVIEINSIGNPTPDRMAEFSPSNQPVKVGDVIFWRNNDERAEHQPMPAGGDADAWVDRIARSLNGQPATSIRFGFQAVPNPPGPNEVQYVCALHANEKGSLTVSKA